MIQTPHKTSPTHGETIPLLSSSMHIIKSDDINEILFDARQRNIKTIYLVPELHTEPFHLHGETPNRILPSVKVVRFLISLFIGLLLLFLYPFLFENVRLIFISFFNLFLFNLFMKKIRDKNEIKIN